MADRPPRYGYTEQGKDPHYLRADNPARTLCNFAATFVPVIQPANPTAVCRWCLDRVGKGEQYALAIDEEQE